MLERRVTLSLLLLTFLLILWGGVVHNTGSSLACPDWPLCYGTLLPKMKGTVAIEHSHRLLAAGVGLGTMFLAGILWQRKQARTLKVIGIMAVLLVVVQGLLGGITVLYKLPTAISTAHLATSLLFFSLLVMIAWRPSPSFRQKDFSFSLVEITLLFVYLQSVLGGLVRHTGAGLVCPDIPFCHGSLWPSAGPTQLHMTHRFGAVLVTLLVLLSFIRYRNSHWLLSGLALLLVLMQIGLGVLSVTTLLGVPVVTAHLGVAALLLATIISLRESL